MILPLNISVPNAVNLFMAGPIYMIDVREEWEWEIAHIAGAQLIPLGALQDHIEELKESIQEGPLVIYCHHGVRSLQATLILRQAGFSNAQSLLGGIDEWSRTQDPTIALY